VVANTDLKALKGVSRKVERFPFGQSFTRGLGTGMNPGLGETAAQNEKEKIKKIFQGQDLCIIIACLGGGAGSGATPIFAKISRSLGSLTYGIFTLPFKFEGEKKMEIAKNTLEEIRPKLNAITIIPNERIFQIIDKTTPLKKALSAINKSLASSLEGLIEIIYEPGLINIDFADLRTILQGRGRLAYLNTVEVQRKEGAAKEAIDKALNSPLYPYSIRGAKGVLYNIAGEKELNLEEVSQISKTILEKVHKEAKIIFGISQGKKYQNIIKTTILATGILMKNFSTQLKKSKLRKKIIKKAIPAGKKGTISLPPESAPRLKKRKIRKNKKPTPTPKKGMRAKKPEKEIVVKPEAETPKDPAPKLEAGTTGQVKIRKNALQLRKEVEEAEKEMLAKESFWETPTFLRKKFFRAQSLFL